MSDNDNKNTPDDKKSKKPKEKAKAKNPWAKGDATPPTASPWGNSANNGSRHTQHAPEIEDILKGAKDSLEKFMPGGFGKGKGTFAVIILAVLLWALSGLYVIEPKEHGVVLTFGKYTDTVETPGLKWHYPWPIQSAAIVNVTNERRIEVGFRDFARAGRGGSAGAQDIADESLILTGDENIIDIDFVVLWRVGNAKNFLYRIRDPEATIKIVAESAMREIIGQTKIQPALTEARTQIQVSTKALMQKMLDEYESGVVINNVQLQKVDPPQPVIDAFNEVQRARQQKEQLRNQAEAYRNDIIPRARGQAEKLTQQAQGYREEVVNKATGDAERFKSIYQSYSKAKTVTAERLYLETMEEVINNANTIILDSGENGAVPYLSINELNKKAPSKAP